MNQILVGHHGRRGPSLVGRRQRRRFASTTASTLQNVTVPDAPPLSKPASDVIAGATARAASQATIHPLDTLKVRMQAKPVAGGLCELAYKKLVQRGPKGAAKAVRSLYRGVLGAASGAGIAIGAYFAFYGVATRLISRHTKLNRSGVAFVSGAAAAAGSSVVKVPLAVCIRSVQAKVYPNPFCAAHSICQAAGPRGLFTGYVPTLLEDVPDMAFKFAAYESLRSLHRRIVGRKATPHEDFLCGAAAGAFAAAATTPLDVVKTAMMCTAAQKPSMLVTAQAVLRNGGVRAFFAGVGPRAASNGINSAVFFTIFECFRGIIARQAASHKSAAIAGRVVDDAVLDVHEVSRSEA